jgi:ATP-dependent RNA helicase DeaD
MLCAACRHLRTRVHHRLQLALPAARRLLSTAEAPSDLPPAAPPSPSLPPPPPQGGKSAWERAGLPHFLVGKVLKQLPGALAPTAIQAAALPGLCADLGGPLPDAVLHSETGSGKTLAYLLPIMARLEAKLVPHARLRAVIVTPTRELAHQVACLAEALGAAGKFREPARALRVLKVVGEVTSHTLTLLRDAPPHILVGTPATLAALLPGHVNIGELQALVLDEADELLRLHSAATVRELAKVARAHRGSPGIVCVSATSSFGLQKFVRETLRKGPRLVLADTTGGGMATPATLAHRLLRVPAASAQFNTFTRMLAALRPPAVLSFHNSAAGLEALEAHLRAKGVRCGVLGNAYANAVRARSLEGIASGRLQVLLSTEMAARGLDLPRLSHVVNFDMPSSLREYVHRAGRVGRLSSLTPGRAGTVLTFCTSLAEVDTMLEMGKELGVRMGEVRLVAGQAEEVPLMGAPGEAVVLRGSAGAGGGSSGEGGDASAEQTAAAAAAAAV